MRPVCASCDSRVTFTADERLDLRADRHRDTDRRHAIRSQNGHGPLATTLAPGGCTQLPCEACVRLHRSLSSINEEHAEDWSVEGLTLVPFSRYGDCAPDGLGPAVKIVRYLGVMKLSIGVFVESFLASGSCSM